jgi:hypothetical protein
MRAGKEMAHDAARLATMISAIGLGMKLRRAIEKGLVRGAREREVWEELSAEVTAMNARGGEVEIPSDSWFP